MSYLVRFEVECVLTDEDLQQAERENDGYLNDLLIVDIAVKKHLKESKDESVKVKPCHVEPLERSEAP